MYDTGIADRLRAERLEVVEVPGWKTRGRTYADFNPRGSCNHHTAGPPDRPDRRTPSLGIVINGRSDLPGPLCNVYLGYDRKTYVVAAGLANHAGNPDKPILGMEGNWHAYGLEIEHTGTSHLPTDMVKIAAKIHAALLRGRKLPASQVVQHHEWAPSRKVDLGTSMHGDTKPWPTAAQFRKLIASELEPPTFRFELVTGLGGDVVVHDKSLATTEGRLSVRGGLFVPRVMPQIVKLAVARKAPRVRVVKA